MLSTGQIYLNLAVEGNIYNQHQEPDKRRIRETCS